MINVLLVDDHELVRAGIRRILEDIKGIKVAGEACCGEDAVKWCRAKEGANKQVISSQADSLIKISRIWADFFPANTSNQP
ncbi:hypothetical protein ACSNMA_22275, partial [Klebsiella pneumoniae]